MFAACTPQFPLMSFGPSLLAQLCFLGRCPSFVVITMVKTSYQRLTPLLTGAILAFALAGYTLENIQGQIKKPDGSTPSIRPSLATINLKHLWTHLQTHLAGRPFNAEVFCRREASGPRCHLTALKGRPATITRTGR